MLREYRKSHENYQFVTQVGSLQHAWESAARQRLSCGSDQSACSTGEETRAHSIGEATWAFVKGWNNLQQSLQPEKERELQASRPYRTPQVDVRHMLLLLLLLFKKIGNARPGVGDWHPISPKTPKREMYHRIRWHVYFCKRVSENWVTLIWW